MLIRMLLYLTIVVIIGILSMMLVGLLTHYFSLPLTTLSNL